MIDTLSALLSSGAIPRMTYAPDSRYYGMAPSTYVAPDGKTITFTSRRFIPQPQRFAATSTHTVVQGERVDVMATQFFGDPLLYWRLCDANLAVRPDDLEASGRVVRITLAAGVGGPPQ